MSTISLNSSSNRVIAIIRPIGSGVNTNLNPSQQSVRDIVAQIHELGEGIEVVLGLHNRPHVVGVGGHSLRVGVVGVGFLDCRAEGLVPEELSDVGYCATGNSV